MDDQRRSDRATLRELRAVRKDRRLDDTEWFDVLYRVYLFALGGLIFVVWASDTIDGLIDDRVTTADLLERGPAAAGVATAVSVAIGLRNGADGGPVSIESADVRHLLMAPIDRRLVLLRPVAQRFRAVAFVPALVLAIVGQLVAREVEGSRAAWAASAALFGVVAAIGYVGSAVVAHAVRLRRAVASVVGGVLVVWQTIAAVAAWNASVDDETTRVEGPFDVVGSLLFWGIRQRTLDVIGLVGAVVLLVAALALCGRLRLEPLERRGQLVSQLRFAATVQDLRTVVLIRRQLRAETVRSRPWFAVGRAPAMARASLRDEEGGRRRRRPTTSGTGGTGGIDRRAVVRRGWVSLSRIPMSRLVRMAGFAALAGVSASLVVTASYLFAVPLVGALFLVGLESLEPLAQEVDRPDLTDALPVDRGALFSVHLAAPAVLMAVMAAVGAAAASVTEPDHAAAAFALGVPVAWAGALGAVVATVRDAPPQDVVASTTITGRDRGSDSPFALPEFAGASNVVKAVIPLALSAVSLAPVAAMRADASFDTAVRSTVAVALCLAVMVWWVRRRDVWAARIRGFFAEGRAAS